MFWYFICQVYVLFLDIYERKKITFYVWDCKMLVELCISWGALIARHDSNGYKIGGTHWDARLRCFIQEHYNFIELMVNRNGNRLSTHTLNDNRLITDDFTVRCRWSYAKNFIKRESRCHWMGMRWKIFSIYDSLHCRWRRYIGHK